MHKVGIIEGDTENWVTKLNSIILVPTDLIFVKGQVKAALLKQKGGYTNVIDLTTAGPSFAKLHEKFGPLNVQKCNMHTI